MGVNIEQLQKNFSTRNIDPYGQVVIVPFNAFQHHWEKDLEAQGHRVFSDSYEGRATFFVRLSKGKSKAVSQTPVQVEPATVTKNNSVSKSFSEQHEGKFVRIPISLLESSPEAVREIYEDIELLAATIKQHGLLEPLIVTTNKEKNSYQVIAGERRLRASKKADLETVPCIVMDGLSADEIKELQLIENVQRKDLKPFEEIKLVKQLADKGLTQQEICFTTGLSHGSVDAYLKIARTLPLETQKEIVRLSHDSHSLTMTKALILAESKEKPEVIAEKLAFIKKEGATPRVLSQKLSQEGSTKLHRVRESRIFWKDLTRTLKKFTEYWDQYSKLKEWEEPDAYHMELHVCLPKDLKELKD